MSRSRNSAELIIHYSTVSHGTFIHIIGIKHDYLCINICWAPREVSKSRAFCWAPREVWKSRAWRARVSTPHPPRGAQQILLCVRKSCFDRFYCITVKTQCGASKLKNFEETASVKFCFLWLKSHGKGTFTTCILKCRFQGKG